MTIIKKKEKQRKKETFKLETLNEQMKVVRYFVGHFAF